MINRPLNQDDAELRELQRDAGMALFIPGTIAAAVAWHGFANVAAAETWIYALDMAIICIPLLAWALLAARPRAAYVLVLISQTLLCVLYGAWACPSLGIAMACIPAAMTTILFSLHAGAAVCVIFSGAIAAIGGRVVVPPGAQIGAIILLWSVQMILLAVIRSATTAVTWAERNFERASALLHEARDQRVQLVGAREDLVHSNAELARLSDRMTELRHQADEARRTKEQFVANVSHELRTPLNMVLGYGEMILRAPQTYGQVPPSLLADLRVIVRNSQHLSGLVDDILDISQLEAGRWALTKERTDLGDLVQEACDAVRPLYASKGLDLVISAPGDLPAVYCDRTRIREVILNLLSNAGRFTERGGVVVGVSVGSGEVTIGVRDSGPGIAVEDQARMFQPFEQVDQSMSRRQGGSGLGLAISKAFVELHDGRMWLESEVGVGTQVFFTLPIAPAEDQAPRAQRWFSPYLPTDDTREVGRAPALEVLPRYVVLESGTALEQLLRRYLDRVEIATVRDMDSALAMLAETPAQALLVNTTSMPAALDQLRTQGDLPFGTPAIICSVPDISDTTSHLGISRYLIKPVERDDLLEAVGSLDMQGNTILIVDDEPDALRLFQRILISADKGYRVLRASDGAQALRIAQKNPPDALLLDLVMPNMDGFHLLQAREHEPALRDVPVIVLSAQDPSRQPIISESIAMVSGNGLSVGQMLSAIHALGRIAMPEAYKPPQEPPTAPPE